MANKEIINTSKAPSAIGSYSQAVKVNNTVYISGQIHIDPNTNELTSGSITEKIELVINNLEAICNEAGGSLTDIVKLNVFLKDLNDFPILNEMMAKYFTKPYPARAAVQVAALPKDADVEIDAIMEIC